MNTIDNTVPIHNETRFYSGLFFNALALFYLRWNTFSVPFWLSVPLNVPPCSTLQTVAITTFLLYKYTIWNSGTLNIYKVAEILCKL